MDIADVLAKANGGGELETIAFPQDLEGKYQRYTQADLAGLRAAGYGFPFISLEEGVSRYFEILRASGGFYR